MNKIEGIVERFWNDIAGLPWKDKAWSKNPILIEQTRQHYVKATVTDLENEALQVVVDKLDAMMEANPSKELAEASNYIQAMIPKES